MGGQNNHRTNLSWEMYKAKFGMTFNGAEDDKKAATFAANMKAYAETMPRPQIQTPLSWVPTSFHTSLLRSSRLSQSVVTRPARGSLACPISVSTSRRVSWPVT